MNRRLIILSQANIETHSRMRSSMILKDSVFRKEQRTHTISPERPTFLLLPCNPPQNQHCRINCMKARARFLFPIPYLLLPQHHVLPFSFHILEYFSKHTKDRKAAWNLNSHRTDNRYVDRRKESIILISCGKNSCFSGRSRKAALRAGCT